MKNAVILAFFSGASFVQLFMISIFLTVIVGQLDDTSYFIDEFYSLDSLFRLLFALSFLTFASGICIMVWKQHDINYIHLMQVEYKDRMNHFQLWKISTITFFIFTSFVVVSLEEMAVIHNKEAYWLNRFEGDHELNDAGKKAASTYKKIVGIFMTVLLIILWIQPTKYIYKRVRYSTIRAFWNVIIAPFGSVKFKAYILAEIMTDCIIPLEDVGKTLTHVFYGNWNANLVN